MRTLYTTYLIILGIMVGPFTVQAQDTDSSRVEVPSDTLVVDPPEEVPQEGEEEEGVVEYQDSTTIMWGNRSRIIITEDKEGNRIIKLVKKKDGEVVIEDDDDWDEDDDWDDEDDYREYKRRKYNNSVDFLAFDLGLTNYYNDNNFGVDAVDPDLEVRAFRPGAHVALHFLPTTVSLFGRGVVNLKTAITIDWTQYYFTKNIRILPDQDTLTWTFPGIEFDKNKLTTRYAQIPLLLNFNTNPGSDNGLSFSIGGYAGVLWGGKTKQVSDEEGKEKVRDEFNLNRFRYGLTARLDLKWLDFYANLNLSQVFEENEDRGINTQSFTVGVNIIDF